MTLGCPGEDSSVFPLACRAPLFPFRWNAWTVWAYPSIATSIESAESVISGAIWRWLVWHGARGGLMDAYLVDHLSVERGYWGNPVLARRTECDPVAMLGGRGVEEPVQFKVRFVWRGDVDQLTAPWWIYDSEQGWPSDAYCPHALGAVLETVHQASTADVPDSPIEWVPTIPLPIPNLDVTLPGLSVHGAAGGASSSALVWAAAGIGAVGLGAYLWSKGRRSP